MKYVVTVVVVFLITIGMVFPVRAQPTGQNQQTVVVEENQTINQDYFAAGNTVIINGTINGDAYIAGNQVLINGVINGDLIAAGNSLTIGGVISQDVRVGGRQVTVTGMVGGNLTAGAQEINLTPTSQLKGSMVMGGQTILIQTPGQKSITLAGNTATITAPVTGNVDAYVRYFQLNGRAKIGGNLTYLSTTQTEISPTATISGTTTRRSPPPGFRPEDQREATSQLKRFLGGLVAFSTLVNGISKLAIGLLFLAVAPWVFNQTTQTITKRPGAAFLSGLLIFIVVPLVLGLLLLTIIGIPLAFIGMALYGILLYLASLPVSYWIGNQLAQTFGWQLTPALRFMLGLILVMIVGLIPLIGWLTKLIILIVGLGALYYLIVNQNRPVTAKTTAKPRR